jgi:hypothetical protein
MTKSTRTNHRSEVGGRGPGAEPFRLLLGDALEALNWKSATPLQAAAELGLRNGFAVVLALVSS